MSNSVPVRDFVDALSYTSKKSRPLALEPISVPRDSFITSYAPFKGKKTTPSNFSYSLVFTAFDVRDYGPDIKKFIKTFANLHIKKVYLETYRDGYCVNPELLKKTKKELEGLGFAVSGCVTTTHLSDRAKHNETVLASSCYTGTAARKKLKEIFERAASLFNEIIVDDWFFTLCRCPECVSAKGKKEWDEYRGRLMADTAKKYVIAAAKKENPRVKLVLKMPQWYENYMNAGYDTEKLFPLFDGICAGTETRDYKRSPYMPVYGGMLMRYLSELAPGKVKSAWFDIYMCDDRLFVEQAYQSVLAGASEIILFCAGALPQRENMPLVESLIEKTGQIDRFKNFSGLFTVPFIREAEGKGDEGLHQYFLMAGIPIYLTPKTVLKEKIHILSEQSAPPSGRAALFSALIKRKKDLVVTAGFAASVKKYFTVSKLKKEIRAEFFRHSGYDEGINSRLYMAVDVLKGRNITLANNAYPVISYMKIKDSAVWVLNLPYSKEEITNHMGLKENAGYRYMLKKRYIVEPLKNIFMPYANINLYGKVKTYFKYEI